MNLENNVSSIINCFKKALQKRIELIVAILNIKGGDEVWRDVNICFHRNFPVDTAALANSLNSYRGLVSTQTLLSQIPFIDNPEEELKRLKEEQQQQLELYTINMPEEDNNDGEENN